jgi:hypothetical protein
MSTAAALAVANLVVRRTKRKTGAEKKKKMACQQEKRVTGAQK